MHAAGATAEKKPSPHVLVVDDDAGIGDLLVRYLSQHGCRVSCVQSGGEMRATLATSPVDIILLDLGLPDEDGLQSLRQLQRDWQGPVIVVSGRGEPVERVVGLELGADDYISKPFELCELLARVHSVLRRAAPPVAMRPAPIDGMAFEGMQLEPAARRLIDRDGMEVPLTSGEFDLLRALVERPNQVLTRDELMNRMHGRDAGPFDRAIDVQIGRLRRKIEDDPLHPTLIRSVRGSGYVLCVSTQSG